MKVLRIAQTVVLPEASEILHYVIGTTDADYLAEFAARDCYQSHNRPNPATRENKDHLGNTLDHKHYSVFEHASVTFRVTGVSRNLTHELIRHRHFSYSQLSQRFVNPGNSVPIVPPIIDRWPNTTERLQMLNAINQVWHASADAYAEIVAILEDGIPEYFPQYGGTLMRKRAREAARAVLPGCTDTIIDITANHRAYREFILKRAAEAADLEIMALAREILRQLLEVAPNTYQDMAKMVED